MTLRAKEIMNTRIMAVTRQVSARDLAVLFLTGTLSGLPVIDQGGKLVGVVSEFDVLKALREKKDLHAVRAEEIMSAIPLCVEEEMTVEDVIRIMLENNLIRLPVVRNDRLIGMISRADVLDHMIESSLVNVYGS
jgi:CBS domain-containing protein